MAKESVVSTIETLSAGVPVTDILSHAGIICLMVFCLLYTPCVAAVAAIRRELGNKYALFTVLLQCSVAWVVAYIVSLFL
jgi:ferrous iron transport protein B